MAAADSVYPVLVFNAGELLEYGVDITRILDS